MRRHGFGNPGQRNQISKHLAGGDDSVVPSGAHALRAAAFGRACSLQPPLSGACAFFSLRGTLHGGHAGNKRGTTQKQEGDERGTIGGQQRVNRGTSKATCEVTPCHEEGGGGDIAGRTTGEEPGPQPGDSRGTRRGQPGDNRRGRRRRRRQRQRRRFLVFLPVSCCIRSACCSVFIALRLYNPS